MNMKTKVVWIPTQLNEWADRIFLKPMAAASPDANPFSLAVNDLMIKITVSTPHTISA